MITLQSSIHLLGAQVTPPLESLTFAKTLSFYNISKQRRQDASSKSTY